MPDKDQARSASSRLSTTHFRASSNHNHRPLRHSPRGSVRCRCSLKRPVILDMVSNRASQLRSSNRSSPATRPRIKSSSSQLTSKASPRAFLGSCLSSRAIKVPHRSSNPSNLLRSLRRSPQLLSLSHSRPLHRLPKASVPEEQQRHSHLQRE